MVKVGNPSVAEWTMLIFISIRTHHTSTKVSLFYKVIKMVDGRLQLQLLKCSPQLKTGAGSRITKRTLTSTIK